MEEVDLLSLLKSTEFDVKLAEPKRSMKVVVHAQQCIPNLGTFIHPSDDFELLLFFSTGRGNGNCYFFDRTPP